MIQNLFWSKRKFLWFGMIFGLVLVCSCSNPVESLSGEVGLTKSYVSNHEIPLATIQEPLFTDEGVPKNKAILISFSVAIDPQSFIENFNITDSLGNSFKNHFLEPQWSNNYKFVKIAADENNLIDLNGKKILDIYLTLSKSCKTMDDTTLQFSIEYKYRISDVVDNNPPALYVANAEVPYEYLKRKPEYEVINLIEGELNFENEAQICTTNHINNKLDFYVEGNDFGGDKISAHVRYNRIYDAAGNEVFEEEKSFINQLSDISISGNYFGKFTLDLSDESYADGMYKIIVTVVDSSDLDSLQSKVYYIIRDTTLAYNANALMWFETPLFRNDLNPNNNETLENQEAQEIDEYQIEFNEITIDEFDSQIATIEKLEFFRNRVKFNYISDDVFYVSKTISETTYKQSYDDLIYLFSWGTQAENLTDPVRIEGVFEENEFATKTKDSKTFILPESYTDFCKLHEEEDIILKATIIDSVGNENVITTIIPNMIELYNYEVLDSSKEGYKTVKFNYSDMSSETNNLPKIQDRYNQVGYRIYYGKIEDEMTEEEILEIPLTRNTAATFENDPLSELNDSPVLEIEEGSNYIVYIQPNYRIYSMTNGQWCGQTFGPLYKVIVDSSIIAEETLEVPEFELQKESAGINTSLFNVNVQILNPQDDVRYVPCYSTDGINWIYYNSNDSDNFSFMVTNPLKAPLGLGEAWDNSSWQDKTYFEAVKAQGQSSFGNVIAKVKILVIKDNETKESEEQELVFTQEDDNIPPAQNNSNTRYHDSILSFDGHSFKYENLIIEDQGHAVEKFKYFFMPYNDAWGSNLSIASTEQIEALPYGIGTFDSITYRNNEGAKYSLNPVIPVNGLKDGKYMFFAKVMDTYGNYNYITLGKAYIGTFKNKLNVQYDSKNKSFISRLNLELGESFTRNMINIQIWNKDSQYLQWENLYGPQNELQDCEVVKTNERRTLYNTTKTKFKRSENGSDVDFTQEIIPGNFYRITMQGFNENTYNTETGQGVNIKYGRPYNKNINKESIVDRVDGETEYDLCTEETVSNTVYYYVPAENEDFKNFSAKFFTSTAAPRSNKPYIVNVISSPRDLGKDLDEWERRGKLIKTHYYNPQTDSSDLFNDNIAVNDIYQSNETGLVYYVVIVHFADNSTAMSNVYKIQCP